MKTMNTKEITGTDGEVIICKRQFLRDIAERRSEWVREPLVLARGSHKNSYFHFGAIFLHPVENLVYHQEEEAMSLYNTNILSLHHYITKSGLSHHRLDKNKVHDGFSVKYAQQIQYRSFVKHTENRKTLSLDLHSSYTIEKVVPMKGYELGVKCCIEIPSITLNYDLCQSDLNFRFSDVFRVTDEWVSDFIKVHQSAYESPLAPFDYVMPKKTRSMWQPRPKIVTDKSKTAKVSNDYHEYRDEQERVKSLYLMKDEICGAYKIGVSINPKHREKTLSAEKPSIKMVGMWIDMGGKEKLWHQHFRRQRMRGEWFDLSPQQVRFFVHRCVNGKGPPVMRKEVSQ